MKLAIPAPVRNYPVEEFQRNLHDICGQFQIAPSAQQQDLSGHLSTNSFADLSLAQVGIEACRVDRTRKDIRRDPGDHFFLILQRKGRAILEQNGCIADITPGDMFLVDSTQESCFRYNCGYSLQLSLHLPREEMRHRFGRRISGGMKVAKIDPLGLSMRALLAKLSSEEGGFQSHVVEAFYSVFGALLTERASGGLIVCNPNRLVAQRALTLIANNFREIDFTTTTLAELTGVSLRGLQRAFKLIGETPHERLQTYRINAAQELLKESIQNGYGLTVSSVAFQCGFSDLSTFYRLYRRTYGHPPRQLQQFSF